MEEPVRRKYSPSHHWVKAEGTRAIIGITDYAQSKTGFILYADLPEKDERLIAGQYYGFLETAAEEHDLLAPLTGRVIDVNEKVQRDPSIVNSSPEEYGWLIVAELEDPAQLNGLWEESMYLNAYDAEND